MNFSVVILILLPMFLDLVYSDESAGEISSVLEFFPEFVQLQEDITKLKKGATVAYNHLKNYRVKGEHSEGAVLLSGQECWIKCTETDGCTSASVQTEGGTCELSRVTYINHHVLERAVGWEVFTKYTPVVSQEIVGYSLGFDASDDFCLSHGLSIATVEDLTAAYKIGYQSCLCGWADNGLTYMVMQERDSHCLNSIGVVRCDVGEATMTVYCKPLKSPIKLHAGYYGRYTLTLDKARSDCESIGTSLATMEDMLEAYRMGFEACSCGWIDNGYAYIVMQKPVVGCLSGVGILACTWQSTWNAWCKVRVG